MLFSIISKLPERFIPSPLMNWLDQYTTKRISRLQQQIIKHRWQQNTLERAVEEIRTKSKTRKKHLQMIDPSVGVSLLRLCLT